VTSTFLEGEEKALVSNDFW